MHFIDLVRMNLTSFERVELWITRTSLFISFCIIGPTIILLTVDFLLWCFRASQEPSADFLKKSKSGIDLLQHHARRLSGSQGTADRATTSALKMSSAGQTEIKHRTAGGDDSSASELPEVAHPKDDMVDEEAGVLHDKETIGTVESRLGTTMEVLEKQVSSEPTKSINTPLESGTAAATTNETEVVRPVSRSRARDENSPAVDSVAHVSKITTTSTNLPGATTSITRPGILLADLNLGNVIQ